MTDNGRQHQWPRGKTLFEATGTMEQFFTPKDKRPESEGTCDEGAALGANDSAASHSVADPLLAQTTAPRPVPGEELVPANEVSPAPASALAVNSTKEGEGAHQIVHGGQLQLMPMKTPTQSQIQLRGEAGKVLMGRDVMSQSSIQLHQMESKPMQAAQAAQKQGHNRRRGRRVTSAKRTQTMVHQDKRASLE